MSNITAWQARDIADAKAAVQKAMTEEKNPYAALCALVDELVESHDFDLPPVYDYPYSTMECAERLRDWVDSGNFDDVPISDKHDIVTPVLYAHLQALRQQTRGWAYCGIDPKGPAFLFDEEHKKKDAAASHITPQKGE